MIPAWCLGAGWVPPPPASGGRPASDQSRYQSKVGLWQLRAGQGGRPPISAHLVRTLGFGQRISDLPKVSDKFVSGSQKLVVGVG